jgi:hypothetical protein
MSQIGRNYIKFDFNDIKLSETWIRSLQSLKDCLLQYIEIFNFNIFNKIYNPSSLNFYSLTAKLSSLNEIYILFIFVSQNESFQEKYELSLKDLYKYLKLNTSFNNISLYYQLTKSKEKPSNINPIYHIDGPLDICESIKSYKIFISPNSFTQSNYNAMLQLYDLIDQYTKDNKTDILHYYGRGMTPISHVLKDNFKKIYGYSSCPISYNDGIKSVKINNIHNIELLYDENKQKFFENINKDENKTIIISASRNGFHKLKMVNKFNKFLYIACNMKSFLKEIKDLPIIYKIIGEIDMFPGTEYKEYVIEINLL